jgi:outer membrane lipoprotein-sorting protein
MKKISPSSRVSRRTLLAAAPALAVMGLAPRLARAALSPADSADLGRVQDYLNNIHTLQSRFEQISGEGGIATGTIYISRPGKMRVEYDPPVPILLVATEGRIWYYDKKLEEVSFFDLKDTPAWFLLQDNVRFGGDITVNNLERDSNVLRVTVTETKNPDLGKATLVLSDHPLELRKWQILDAQQKNVTVTLDDPHYGPPLSPNLFYWTDPRPPNARRGG